MGISGKPFPFFDLPAELRRKILDIALRVDRVVDIECRPSRQLALLRVSKRFTAEASSAFYGGNTFRLLPTQPAAVAKGAKPLIRRFSPRHRALLISLELRLGTFWTKPPHCWRVNRTLGLEDAAGVRVLNVEVDLDPSSSMFEGFRKSENFYTDFSGNLLRQVIKRLPNLAEVRLDGSPSTHGGPLMQRLVEEVRLGGKRLSWGPEHDRGTNAEDGDVLRPFLTRKAIS